MSFWLAVAALAAALTGHSITVAAQDAAHVIPSYLGHLAGGPANEASAEYAFVTAQIRKFLAELAAK